MLLPFPAQHLNALRHCEARLALANRRASSRIPILSYGFELFLDFRAQPNFPINVPKLPHGEVWGLGTISQNIFPTHLVTIHAQGRWIVAFARFVGALFRDGEVWGSWPNFPKLPHHFPIRFCPSGIKPNSLFFLKKKLVQNHFESEFVIAKQFCQIQSLCFQIQKLFFRFKAISNTSTSAK